MWTRGSGCKTSQKQNRFYFLKRLDVFRQSKKIIQGQWNQCVDQKQYTPKLGWDLPQAKQTATFVSESRCQNAMSVGNEQTQGATKLWPFFLVKESASNWKLSQQCLWERSKHRNLWSSFATKASIFCMDRCHWCVNNSSDQSNSFTRTYCQAFQFIFAETNRIPRGQNSSPLPPAIFVWGVHKMLKNFLGPQAGEHLEFGQEGRDNSPSISLFQFLLQLTKPTLHECKNINIFFRQRRVSTRDLSCVRHWQCGSILIEFIKTSHSWSCCMMISLSQHKPQNTAWFTWFTVPVSHLFLTNAATNKEIYVASFSKICQLIPFGEDAILLVFIISGRMAGLDEKPLFNCQISSFFF